MDRNFGVLGNLIKSYKLHEHQLSPFAIYEEESVDGFVRGLTTQPTQSMDASFSPEVITPVAKKRHPFATLWYEIRVLWPNIKPVKSHTSALGFRL